MNLMKMAGSAHLILAAPIVAMISVLHTTANVTSAAMVVTASTPHSAACLYQRSLTSLETRTSSELPTSATRGPSVWRERPRRCGGGSRVGSEGSLPNSGVSSPLFGDARQSNMCYRAVRCIPRVFFGSRSRYRWKSARAALVCLSR